MKPTLGKGNRGNQILASKVKSEISILFDFLMFVADIWKDSLAYRKQGDFNNYNQIPPVKKTRRCCILTSIDASYYDQNF